MDALRSARSAGAHIRFIGCHGCTEREQCCGMQVWSPKKYQTTLAAMENQLSAEFVLEGVLCFLFVSGNAANSKIVGVGGGKHV